MFTLSNSFHNETYKIFTTEQTTVYVESRFSQWNTQDFHKGTYKCLRWVTSQRNTQMFTFNKDFHKGTYKRLRWVTVFTKQHTYVYVVYAESRFSQRNIHMFTMFTLSHGFHKGTYICLRWVTVFTKEQTDAKSDQWPIHTEAHNRSKRSSFQLIRNDRLSSIMHSHGSSVVAAGRGGCVGRVWNAPTWIGSLINRLSTNSWRNGVLTVPLDLCTFVLACLLCVPAIL